MGDVQAGARRRAVGTRDRIMRYLAAAGEISDPHGMASTALADAIGYPGSSIAFAQLLSGMEKSGLIERDVRGKRTYRITPAAAPAAVPAGSPGAASSPRRASRRPGRPETGQHGRSRPGTGQHGTGQHGTGQARGGRGLAPAPAGAEDFDYDELARRLLVQVVQRLATVPPDAGEPPVAGPPPAGAPGPPAEDPAPGGAALARTVESLEHKLASVRTKQRKLTEENARLREQLRAAQESLARAQEHADSGRIAGQLGSAEAGLLERLLSPLGDRGDRPEADTG